MATELVSAKIVVSGLVQGVGYRFFAVDKARILGLKGYVRNLHSSDVEVVVEGEKGMISELIKELKVGPRSAEVGDIKIEWDKFKGQYKEFSIKF